MIFKEIRLVDICVLLICVELTTAAVTVVTGVNPKYGSLAGQTRITIDGRKLLRTYTAKTTKDFAKNMFSFGDGNEHVGNTVTMVSATKTFPCEIHRDGSHETQLMCYTVPMPEDDYYIRVAVDGVDVPVANHCNCKFRPSATYTPKITSIHPRSGKPGSQIKITGRIVTDRYGSNLVSGSNGRTERMLRVYFGGQTCELKDLETDQLYGVTLDSSKSQNGNLDCKVKGTFIGHANGSFIVEGIFGRSAVDSKALHLSSTNDIYMFQTYTGISSLSHNSGSVKGGLRLSIYGQYFDETQAPVKVMVGTTECRVVEPVKDEVIVCQVEAKPSAQPAAHIGNRGLLHEIWNATTKSNSNFDDVRNLSISAADYSTELVDETAFYYTDKFNYVDRMKGFFVPPKTGEYKFYIQTDDSAKFYLSTDENEANLTLITSQTIYLVRGNSYAIEIIRRQVSSTSSLKISAKLFKTEYTESVTGHAVQEIQKININSVVTKDTFTLNVTSANFTETTIPEIQIVAVESSEDCTFRLGMYGTYTALLSVLSSYEDIQEAIEALPGVIPDKVEVTIAQTSNGANIYVTFNSIKGDLPEMTYIISEEFQESTNITVTEITQGLPSLESYQFMMDGIPSPLVSPTASADEVRNALLKMFSVQCPDYLGNPSGTTLFRDFESTGSSYYYGTPVFSPGPFCGRKSAVNPRYLYLKGGSLGISLSQYKALCFAFKGKLTRISMRFSYEDGAGETRSATTYWVITAGTPTEWVFQCWDMFDKAKAARPDSADRRVVYLYISRAATLYIDSVSIGRSPLTTDSGSAKQRMAAAKPNGALIRGVEVTSSSPGVYTIVLDPFDCGNDFPMLEVAHAKLNSGSSNGKNEVQLNLTSLNSSNDFQLNSTSSNSSNDFQLNSTNSNSSNESQLNSTSSNSLNNTATYILSNGESNIILEFVRTVRASPPVTGTFKIGIKGQTTESLSPSLTATEVESEMEALSEFGDVSVVKTGTCSSFAYQIKWVSKAGDQPLITVDSQLEGNAVTHTIQPIQDGGLFLDPIPGDMLRTLHSQPQVRLWINNIPATCDTNCSFDWSTAQTPRVTTVHPTSGTESLGTSITITGTGFYGTADNNTVVIGGVPCGVTASTNTTITCTVGNGPTGSHDIQVTVDGKGDASGSISFEYVASILSISPNNGSIGGGTRLTVTGYGFMSNASVTVGGDDCSVISSGQANIVCTTPLAVTTSGGAVDVIVTQSSGSPLTSPTQFTYDASSAVTPIITSISTSTSSIQGGENISITGTGFGSSNNLLDALQINNMAAVILSYTDTVIEATLPSNQHGSYPILLYVPNQGFADLRTNGISNIVYTLEVTNVFPSKGSLYGGTRVTITGKGFPLNTILLDIKFGRHVCDVESVTSTQVICVIQDTGVVHTIRNNGTHRYWGYGYEWYPMHPVITVGDRARFVWSCPKWLYGITAGVKQKVNASSTLFPSNGFTSGPRKANGVYERRFTRSGIIYYWSDYVDDYERISYAGTIQVNPRTSHFEKLTFKVAGYEAAYSPGGDHPSQSGACPGTTSAIINCTDPEPTPTDTSRFNFIFWSCLSPIVTKMTPSDGTTGDSIYLEGSGFGSSSCENEIKIGTAGGLVQTTSASAVSFKVDPSAEPAIGIISMLTLRVNNLGNALIDLSDNSSAQTFSLRPFVSSITPASGSTAGGTKLTLAGSGFQGTTSDITVNVDVYPCTVESVTYTKIVCSTPAIAASTVNISLSVEINGQPFPAECDLCSYTFSSDDTPSVSAANPSTITGSDLITIDGVFGDVNASSARVVIADQICTVTLASASQITCDIAGLPNGNHALNVFISGKGKASGDVIIRSPATISSLTPTTGSVHGGGQLTIDGNGFNSPSLVNVNRKDCVIIAETFTQINCTLPANSEMSTSVVVLSNDQTYESRTFGYVQSESPSVSSINPTSGTASSSLTVTGTGYSSTQGDNTVSINGVPCVVTDSTQTTIICILGDVPAGSYSVKVLVAGVGYSDSFTSFTYEMTFLSISQSSGSSAGGQTVTIVGTGFVTNDLSVTICGETCTLKTSGSQSSTQYVCLTPASTTAVNLSKSCDVVATQNFLVQTLSSAFTYEASLTPDITNVFPVRGGTAGGTTITITGTGFGTTIADVTVTIAGYRCIVTDVTAIQITCITESARSVNAKVVVEIGGNGIASQTSADFEYIDVWSSIYTWGGNSPPAAGDLVVIPANQTILLDTDTPVLKMLLIKGGKVIFDEKDVELKAEIILITDGGVLQVGTETHPFLYKGIITLYGHVRSKELPIYGTKCLAVRNGTLDLHGRPTHVTWTLLASTANPGDTQITLKVPVEWQVNDEVVIATTSHRHSQKESEVRKIANVSGNKMTLTLDKALTYKHLGITETIDGRRVDFRAEVGLLTRNIVVRGNRNQQWVEKIEACPAGFNTGQFATQTCFQGRFGEEMGSDQFGVQIIMHAPRKDENIVIGRLEYVEVTYAGQAFRLGRYPVHFHLNGKMDKSYVRGLAIHETFNRAVNVHNTHDVLIEHTVVYNVMGGAFFLEDGIETGNTFIFNLAVFVRSSSSLLNDDITPAAFWATNPNNIISHNHVAGGTHFGVWYKMNAHPEGPSATLSICPKHVPLGEFLNNTVHSNGWFGLWIFPDYFPKENGACSSSAPCTPAVFRGLTSWNCEKGAEFVNGGALQFEDFVLVNSEFAGFEGKRVVGVPQYTDEGPMLNNSLIVGSQSSLDLVHSNFTGLGLILPYFNGFQFRAVTFVNFQSQSVAIGITSISGLCSKFCGGFKYKSRQLRFINADNRVKFKWLHEAVFEDEDGTLSGTTGNSIVPTMGTLPPSKCISHASTSIGIPASSCQSDVKFRRFAFNNAKPSSLYYKDVVMMNKHGSTKSPFASMYTSGWLMLVVYGYSYTMVWENAGHLSNISYVGSFYDLEPGTGFILHQQTDRPDKFMIDGVTPRTESEADLDITVNNNGDWKYNATTGNLAYVVAASRDSRKKRASSGCSIHSTTEIRYNLRAYKCYYTGCIPPPNPIVVSVSPQITMNWSSNVPWEILNRYKPVLGDDVTIPAGMWLMLDESPPKLGILKIEGGLEFTNDVANLPNLKLEANIIHVTGRLVVGWEHTPHEGNAEIVLHGTHTSGEYPTWDGPAVGAKAIGVFGGLELHGKDSGIFWTKLAQTADSGTNSLILTEAVEWVAGDEIVISTTSFSVWQTETFKISAISGDKTTLTLNDSLSYKHIAFSETLTTGENYTLAASVGLLTRNIKIRGAPYDQMIAKSFGARIIVGRTVSANKKYVGFARISNTEFIHTGQEGYVEYYDPRYSVAFLDVTQPTSFPFQSYVKSCAFHNGFAPAIGVFGVNNMVVENNVIHQTVGSSIVITGKGNKLIKNMMVLNQWSGSYLDRREWRNTRYDGSVEVVEATDLYMSGNVVAGSERIGYHLGGQSCSSKNPPEMEKNEAHGCSIGVGLLPTDKPLHETCAKYSNYIVWRNVDFGIYYNNEASARFSDNILVDNRVSLFPMVIGPSSLSHAIGDKFIEVTDSLFVGHSPSFDCAFDKVDGSDVNIQLSGQGRSFGNGSMGVTGLITGTFTSSSNGAPGRSFINIMSYNAINGIHRNSGLTFARFATHCSDYDYAISTNPSNDDGAHPFTTKQLTFDQVGENNKVFYHIPNVRKINPSDCVDMDCDGLKKGLIVDLDGTLLNGNPGSVIPWSEYQWNGDSRRGLGDYRIPKTMLTDVNGNRIDVNVIAPNKGIVRNNQCVFKDYWRAYECHNIEHKMLTIESMDPDTETRRVSPVAVLVNRYIDLINGPQDHGWCSGYTCRKRVSTFQSLVQMGESADIVFTGTTPQTLRLFLLNADVNDAVRISVWFACPNRLDVYVNNIYKLPKNGRFIKNKFFLDPPKTSVEFKPDLTEPLGTNYVSREENIIYVLLRGSTPVEIRTSPVIIVSFSLPAMTVDEFFNENLVRNLAAFFDLDPRKVRVVNVINENSGVKRRKRTTPVTQVVVEIGDEPGDSGSGSLTYDSLTNVTEEITNHAQFGSFDSIVNATVLGISTIDPTPPPTSAAWSQVNNENPVNVITKPSHLEFVEAVVAGREQNTFTTSPMIRVKDTDGNYMTALGASTAPWQIIASLRAASGSDSRGVLSGTKLVTFVNGWANFTDFSISHMGSGYIIDFAVTAPAAASNFTLATTALTVPARTITANLVSISTSLLENENIELILDLRDADTASVVSDIAWRNHTWYCEASLADPSLYLGALTGTTNVTFDTSMARAAFQSLTLSSIGTYYIDFHIYTEPAEYDFHYEKYVVITNSAQDAIVVQRSNIMEVKLDGVYDPATASYIGVKVMNYYIQKYKNMQVRIIEYTVSAGSILVSLSMEGSLSAMNSSVYYLCDSVVNGTSFTYGNINLNLLPHLQIDGSPFYGVSCGQVTATTTTTSLPPSTDNDDGLDPGVIAALVILSIALVAIIVAFIVWKCCVKPNTKTHDMYQKNNSLMSAEDTFNQNWFSGLEGSSSLTPVPPVDTSCILPIDRHHAKLRFKH